MRHKENVRTGLLSTWVQPGFASLASLKRRAFQFAEENPIYLRLTSWCPESSRQSTVMARGTLGPSSLLGQGAVLGPAEICPDSQNRHKCVAWIRTENLEERETSTFRKSYAEIPKQDMCSRRNALARINILKKPT